MLSNLRNSLPQDMGNGQTCKGYGLLGSLNGTSILRGSESLKAEDKKEGKALTFELPDEAVLFEILAKGMGCWPDPAGWLLWLSIFQIYAQEYTTLHYWHFHDLSRINYGILRK